MFITNKHKLYTDNLYGEYTDFGYKIIYVIGHILSSLLLHLEYKKSRRFLITILICRLACKFDCRVFSNA
jgi:hypothetical protein